MAKRKVTSIGSIVLARMISTNECSTMRTGVLPALQTDLSSVEAIRGEIRWDLYPRVSRVPAARAFVIRLSRLARRPKTVDAYARDLDRFLARFADAPAERWLEAD